MYDSHPGMLFTILFSADGNPVLLHVYIIDHLVSLTEGNHDRMAKA